jgi:hypothetical protein
MKFSDMTLEVHTNRKSSAPYGAGVRSVAVASEIK